MVVTSVWACGLGEGIVVESEGRGGGGEGRSARGSRRRGGCRHLCRDRRVRRRLNRQHLEAAEVEPLRHRLTVPRVVGLQRLGRDLQLHTQPSERL